MKNINPIKKQEVKSYLKQGFTAKDALLKAHYSKATAHNATKMSVVKHCQEEIKQELRAKDITVDLVIKRLNEDRDLAIAKQDYATATKVDELLGKYLALFTDKQQLDANIVNKEEQSIVDKYISSNRLPTTN